MLMIKKIAGFFKKRRSPQSQLNFEKKHIGNSDLDVFDEYSQRLPGFPLGIPVIPVELLIEKNREMIKEIILARGLAGTHNKDEVERKIMSPIRHLAEMTHLLPASEKNHFKLVGGLFSFCLEVSLFSIRYAERRILTRATPEIRKEEESLWTHAAFLNGLFSEAITAIAKISIYAEDVGIEWRPGGESLYEWLVNNELKRYHLRWSETEDRSTIYIMAGKAIQKQQTDIFAAGEKAIYKTLYAALQDQKDHSNPLANIVDTVRYKIMERDEWRYADRYGKPLAGMHLEPWLIDAMRHLVQKKRWAPNEENGRIWHGNDGVFLVWPLAASDMQYELKASECPFIPNTQEILADILLDAGIIESNSLGGYLFDIAVPVVDSKDKKSLEALKLARYEVLFVRTHHKPIDGNLGIQREENEWESVRNEQNQSAIQATETELASHQEKESHDHYAEDSQRQNAYDSDFTHGMDLIEQERVPANASIKDDEDSGKALLLGMAKKLDEHPAELTTNHYDDDYAADYQPTYDNDYRHFHDENQNSLAENEVAIKSKSEGNNADPINKKATKKKSRSEPPTSSNKSSLNKDSEAIRSDKSLIGALIAQSKSDAGKKTELPLAQPPEADYLVANKPKATISNEIDRVDLVLNALKNLPEEYVSVQPGGITKVMVKGLRNVKLELNDCISVLKAAGLIELVDGRETGIDKIGKGSSRYFLIRENLCNGK